MDIGTCDRCMRDARHLIAGHDSFGVHVVNVCAYGCENSKSVAKEETETLRMANSSKVVEKYFRVFDQACKKEGRALEILEGWEHKEKMTEIFVVLEHSSKAPEQIDLLSNDYIYYETEIMANESLDD